jgi:hypothetical protein
MDGRSLDNAFAAVTWTTLSMGSNMRAAFQRHKWTKNKHGAWDTTRALSAPCLQNVEGRVLTCSKKGAPKHEDKTRRRRNREANEKRPQAARYLLDFGVDARLRRNCSHSHRWRLAGGGPGRGGSASGRSRRRHLVSRHGIPGLNALRGRNAHTRNSISRLRRTYPWRIAPLTRRETNRL